MREFPRCRTVQLDLDLLGEAQSFVEFNPELPHRLLDLGVTEQNLRRAQIVGLPVVTLVRRKECIPYREGSSPMILAQSFTMRLY